MNGARRCGEGRGEGGRLARIGALSLAAHVAFGAGVVAVDLSSLVTPGVWEVGATAPVALTLAGERTWPVEIDRPVRREEAATRAALRKEGERAPKGEKRGGGGGDPLARVTRMGVLGRLGGGEGAKRAAAPAGEASHASDGLAQLLRGAGARRRAPETGGSPRSGIGFGGGEGSGFGGGAAARRAEDLVASFGDGTGDRLVLEKRFALGEGGTLPYIEGGGCRDEAEIARIVESHRGAIRGCYNRSLLVDPDRRGEIGVRFVIDPGGEVRDAEVISRSFDDAGLEACLVRRILEWRFSSEEGCETLVRYLFHFSSGIR